MSITIYWPGATKIGVIKGNSHEESEIYSQKIALTEMCLRFVEVLPFMTILWYFQQRRRVKIRSSKKYYDISIYTKLN